MNANTAIAQLGGNRIFAMAFDARGAVARADSLTLRIARSLVRCIPGKATHLVIELEPSDTYRVTLLRVGKLDAIGTTVAEIAGVYADMLRGVVEDMTGLRLSL